MARYDFKCEDCNQYFEYEKPMKDDFPDAIECTACGSIYTRRIFGAVPDIWHTDGAHKTDYTSEGHKQDLLRRRYELATGEKAPPPAKNVPRNYVRE